MDKSPLIIKLRALEIAKAIKEKKEKQGDRLLKSMYRADSKALAIIKELQEREQKMQLRFN